MKTNRSVLIGILMTAVLFISLVVVLAFGGDDTEEKAAASTDETTTTTTTEPSEEEDARECPDTWLIVDYDYEDDAENPNRLFTGTELNQMIREAATDEDAREALNEWLTFVRRDPEYFAGNARLFIDREVDPAILTDAERKCATAEAETLLGEFETALLLSEVAPGEAPADGTNTGVSDGNIVAASQPGITGDRDAIHVKLPNGKEIWILARCGNPVVKGPAPLPPGPTDQPPPPTTTTTKVPPPPPPPPGPKCPDGSPVPPNGLCPKNSEESVNNNPAVPPQVRKTQPSPDNQTEAAKPPREPVETPTGCTDRCDEDDGFAPTTTAAPRPDQGQGDSGEGTTNTTSPPTTKAPAPAPPTTASPSPSTTNPPPPPG